ncbi:histone acetylation protein-domain-containing protein [Myxozyma melibiosi]|uniref:histone acetyltransferase n=1 Tax=Myxozyma melibiosi TaxID=54550 RepID=A0ABR1FB02_9ASCO
MADTDSSGAVSSVWDRNLSNALPRTPTQPEPAPDHPQQHPQQPFVLYHISTKPKKQALTEHPSASSGTVSTHLVLVEYDGIYVLALEVQVYRSPLHTTLFVSKADSTGFCKLNLRVLVSAILRVLLTATARPEIPTRICLFARAQPQYLFPDSGSNGFKHVLSDRQLIRWWIKTLDPLLSLFTPPPLARLLIPGADKAELKPALQSSSALWSAGHIFHTDTSSLAIETVPNFPDDPKSRFLDSLAAENRGRETTVAHFFDELQMRQEFLLGFVVGIIGVEGVISCSSSSSSSSSSSEDEHLGAVVEMKTYTRIHDAIVTGNYGSIRDTRNATAAVRMAMPEGSRFEIMGTLVGEEQSRKKTEPVKTPAVNVMSGMMVRKRAKPPRDVATAPEQTKKAKIEE